MQMNELSIPLEFWFGSCPEIALYIPHLDYSQPTDQFGRSFCGCSENEEVLKKPVILNHIKHLGLYNVIQSRGMDDLDIAGEHLVLSCLYFLFLMYEYPSAYVSLQSFICDYLKVTEKDSGYDYWLMNWLEWNNLTEHGGSIRGCYISDTGIKLIEKHPDEFEKINDWIDDVTLKSMV